jgi:hypothetical protein
MHADYADITSRIAEPPTWWDENGTPRFGAFTHDACPNIYADTVVLLEIGCQGCDRRFMVELSGLTHWNPLVIGAAIHYGDPPRHGGCMGETMNCDDLRLVEVWKKETYSRDWVRHVELETALPDGMHPA